MATVQAMDLNKKTAITVASAEPIRKLLREMVNEADERTRYLAGKVSAQAFVNGLILWLRSRPVDERTAVVDEALRLIAAVEQDVMSIEDVIGESEERKAGKPRTLTTNVPFYGQDDLVEPKPARVGRRKK